MTMKVLGYAAESAQVPLAPLEFTRRSPRPDDVVMEVLYCGVCHSDLHQAHNDWGFSTYPLVPGHEVIGRVTAIGKGSKVAVVGLGGLGHMALKLANALGAEVTLFTRSASKEADARRLGAHHIVLSTEDAQMAAAKGQFDLIIDTVPYVHDLMPYIPTLKVDGTLVLVGYLGDLSPMLNTMPLILARRSVAGSCIGGIAETQEMLDFCAKHGIVSDIEMINIQDINEAYERMVKSDVKYRFVIDMASLKA